MKRFVTFQIIFLLGCGSTLTISENNGVGVFDQPEPYEIPSEAAGSLNNAPAGRLSGPDFYQSRIYDSLKFRYYIYVPAQYDPSKPACVMVLQDGTSAYLNVMKAPQVFDNLINSGEIPVTICLFIDPGTPSGIYHYPDEQNLRSMEYDAMDDKYSRFLTQEIIPDVIQKDYSIVNDPDGWAIAGQSSGGIAAFTAAWQRPNKFHKVITHNGSFVNIRGGNAYPDIIRKSEPKPLRVYLLSGTKDLNNEYGNWLEANKAMASALAEKGYSYRFMSGTGGHFPPLQGMADFPNALRWLWKGYSIPQ